MRENSKEIGKRITIYLLEAFERTGLQFGYNSKEYARVKFYMYELRIEQY